MTNNNLKVTGYEKQTKSDYLTDMLEDNKDYDDDDDENDEQKWWVKMFEEQDDDDGDMKLKFEAIFIEVEVSS